MKQITIVEKMRCAHVKRWHVVRVLREQNLAEHQYLVWLLSTEIAKRLGVVTNTAEYRMVVDWALVHDQPEVIIGDWIPYVKEFFKTEGPHHGSYEKLETHVSPDNALMRKNLESDWPHVLSIVSLADKLSDIWFLRDEGNGPHAFNVRVEISCKFNDELRACWEKYPMLNWESVGGLAKEIGCEHV